MLKTVYTIFQSSRSLGLTLLCAYFLVACSGNTTLPEVSSNPFIQSQSIDELIALAEQQPSPDKERSYILLAEELLKTGEISKGLNLLNRIDAESLSDTLYIRYALAKAGIYYADQVIFNADTQLTNPRFTSLQILLTNEQKQEYLSLKADIDSQLGNIYGSVENRVALSALLTEQLDITENNELLWQALSRLSLEELQTQEAASTEPTLKGWYQLALLSKQNETSLDNKQGLINRWVADNPTHPASLELPLDLQLLTSLIASRPEKVALLLPLEGKLSIAGKTIRDGFMAAYYHRQQDYTPAVSIYDTSAEAIGDVYDLAVSEGADLIIGPLEKDKLSELQNRPSLPVPLLGLNYIVDDLTAELPAPNLYQFGLSLEDEAIQAADRAWLEGHRSAMVLASRANWSQRAANAFRQRWEEKGGIIAVTQDFDKDSNYSDTIKAALSIDESRARARTLMRLFGKKVEFEPRRRKDIDMIFLVARSSQGQQLKPTLAFHYAGNVPVYATSQIYSPKQSVSKNSDLNGIRFTTLPWTLEPEKRDPALFNESIKVPPNYERLYAMGIDAFRLHDRLQQLSRSPNANIDGTTGKLSMDLNKRIIRQQPWAEIVKGQAQPLPYLTQENSEQ